LDAATLTIAAGILNTVPFCFWPNGFICIGWGNYFSPGLARSPHLKLHFRSNDLSTTRYRGTGGGRFGGGGSGYNNMMLSFPPFTWAVKWLIIVNVAIYFLLLIGALVAPGFVSTFNTLFALVPALVAHGYIWQIFTYAFLHAGLWHVLINMLMLWMFGAQLEIDIGHKQFLEFYFFCVLGAALTTIVMAFTGVLGLSPFVGTIGASGGVYGVLLAFGMLYGDREIFMFPLPFTIKAKYMVAILVLIVLATTFQPGPGGIANMAHLGGLFFAYLYLKFLPRRGLMYGFSERYFGARNSYYRWKRRRAARKFEVYMRKHDSKQFFDEYGNFREPENWEKKDGEDRPPWVN
jgi:membrane associated rhomboid family serine protease